MFLGLVSLLLQEGSSRHQRYSTVLNKTKGHRNNSLLPLFHTGL